MAKGYEAPVEVRELEKKINEFTYRYGLDIRDVFQDLLRYIINGFSIPGSPSLSNWRYTKKQTEEFYYMYVAWIGIMNKQITKKGYYDAWGDLFMALTSRHGQQQKGQFFTPEEVVALCQNMIIPESNEVKSVHDPAAGSGRMLIASRMKNPRSYLVGWDIDYTCCLMCVSNFLINGCVGEVVCINSLTMNNFRGAWLINEGLHRTGLPTIRWMDQEEYNHFKQAHLPPYLFFLDQEHYVEYFKMREFLTQVNSLFK